MGVQGAAAPPAPLAPTVPERARPAMGVQGAARAGRGADEALARKCMEYDQLAARTQALCDRAEFLEPMYAAVRLDAEEGRARVHGAAGALAACVASGDAQGKSVCDGIRRAVVARRRRR